MCFNIYIFLLLSTMTTVSLGGTLMNRNNLPLSSKVIFQSPMVENVYKDIVLSSKPLNLKKYATAKPKNSKKDSKIYYIPIGPMPYQISPVLGYNYQPVKISPQNKKPPQNFLQAFLQNFQQNPQKVPQNLQPQNQQSLTPITNNITPNVVQIVPQVVGGQNAQSASPAALGLPNTQLIRLNGHAYYFNGRPYRLKAYRAAPKLNVNKNNLNSHLFFNKNIIY